MSTKGTCTHIKVSGIRCGSPALKGEEFCYFHQNAHRTVRRPKQSRLHPIALIEDEESIQYALMEVMNALMRNTIDLKRATLILRALHIAVKNASRVKYSEKKKEMVTETPKYAEPETPETEEDISEITPIDLPAVAANPNLRIGPEGPHYWEQKSEAPRRKAREDVIRFDIEAKVREENRKRFAEERDAEAKARAEAAAAHVETAASAVQAKPRASASANTPAPTTVHVGAHPLVRPATPSEARKNVPPAGATTKPTTIPSHDFKQPSQPVTDPPHNFKTPAPNQPIGCRHAPTRSVCTATQAPATRTPSSEGAQECSPKPALSEAEGRKPWVTRQ